MSISSVGLTQTQPKWPSFQTTDTNGDDSISLQEFTAAGQNMPGGIGGLDSSSLQSLFSAIDTDGSGGISTTEAKTAVSKLSNALQSMLLGTQEQSSQPSPSQMFAAADTDGSGGLSFDEFKADVTSHLPNGATAPTDDQLQAMFNKIDTDGDGQISQSEMKAAHHGHHHHGPPPDQTADTSNSDAIFGPNPFSTTPAASDSSGSTGTQLPTDMNSLLLQAMSAYNANPGQTTSDALVSQLADLLKAV
ncbi:MAG: EF-hand domain-containing protein [Pseudolabrys sp.]|nr:EF-hand domain-containing protein [Pseudolabrys sp.]